MTTRLNVVVGEADQSPEETDGSLRVSLVILVCRSFV